MACDDQMIGLGFRDACRNGADTNLRAQFDTDASVSIRVLKIVNELCHIFDRIDVVVGWRAD